MAKFTATSLNAIALHFERKAVSMKAGLKSDTWLEAAAFLRETEIKKDVRPVDCQQMTRGDDILGGFIG